MAHEFDPEGPSPVPPLSGGAIDYDPKPVPPPPPRPVAPPPSSSSFPIVMSLVLTGLGIGAFFLGKKMEADSAAPAPAPAMAAEAKDEPAKPTDAAPAPTPAEAKAELAPMKDELAAMTKRLDELQAKIEAVPKAEAGDLKPLQEKVEELAKVPEMVAPLPKRLDDLDGKLAELGTGLDGLKAEVAALKAAPTPTPTPAPAAEAAAEARPEDVSGADAAMGQAVDLFKQAKYKDAAAAFTKLSEADGNDARVWYYAALSNGLATRNWGGDTATLVTKGVEREKAGSPSTDKIDEVFADLTPKTGKEWLAGYRKRAK